MNKIIGIYKITNPKGFTYIGKSYDIVSRIRSYRTHKCYGQPYLLKSLIDFGFLEPQSLNNRGMWKGYFI